MVYYPIGKHKKGNLENGYTVKFEDITKELTDKYKESGRNQLIEYVSRASVTLLSLEADVGFRYNSDNAYFRPEDVEKLKSIILRSFIKKQREKNFDSSTRSGKKRITDKFLDSLGESSNEDLDEILKKESGF